MTSFQARLAVALVLAAVAWAAPQRTFAADLGSGPPPPPSPPYSGWTLNVTPYAWAPFVQGDVTVKGRTVDIDVNPIELLGHLDAVPFMAYTEARKGPKKRPTKMLGTPQLFTKASPRGRISG